MIEASFEVEIDDSEATRFAEISGDWNPLHTDVRYAAATSYRRPILHGAYSAGLMSRMAGMYLPGQDCLLLGMKLRFVAPIIPPAKLLVEGRLAREGNDGGLVEIFISDVTTGIRYVSGSYEFGLHQHNQADAVTAPVPAAVSEEAPILVTGASGGLGAAMLARLGAKGLGVSRSGAGGALHVASASQLPDVLAGRRISGVVHCGGPRPDNQRLVDLGRSTDAAISHHLAEPLAEAVKLAQLLATHGLPGATLVLVGSTAALPGRHNWRTPVYSLAKSMVPTLTSILALELGGHGRRCVGVVFDVIDGDGMNAGLRESVRQSHIDRSPSGNLATPEQAADHIAWILDQPSTLISGAVLTLSGGALP